jgi:hypothetical protein
MDPEERESSLESLRQIKGRDAYRRSAASEFAERLLSKADPPDVQEIAAGQIQLLDEYHEIVLGQARKSFVFAVAAAVTGIALFAFAVVLLLLEQSTEVAIFSGIAGAIVEVISGIGFYLYAKASGQLAEFQSRLDRTQRFLLANSVCGSLKGSAKDKARTELIRAIAGMSSLLPDGERGRAAESKEGEEGA